MIVLEDGLKYCVIKEIKKDNTVYVYLTHIKDVTKICIRKTTEDRKNLYALDSESEFSAALQLFAESIV